MPDASTPDLAALREAAAAAQKALEEAEHAAVQSPENTADPAETTEPETTEPAATEPAATGRAGVEPAEAAPQGYAAEVAAGYAAEATLPLGALLEGEPGGEAVPNPQVQVGFALSMLNRHGLVAGATGTGKTKTLQGMAEGLSLAGVPVFLADVKGDLSGLALPGPDDPKVAERAASIGQDWTPTEYPVEFYSLGGIGKGVPIRTTVTDFGPLLLSKVLGLNATQESSLTLIFHWADKKGLALLDLKDLQSVIAHLTSDEGKAELKGIGGISAATAGVILREIVGLEGQGADVFFGEPAFSTSDLIATRGDLGVLSVLELPAVQDRPQLFSTFLMWLLADLFQELPEVGDVDKPKLVFFFDEAHLLFADASKDFLQQVVRTVRLIRSKGVGVFFVTQSPKDVPSDVLAQLGNRVQHALRAFTPDDATALRAAARTFPKSPYDLERLLQELGTGEAVVTVLTEKGAPSPVAWTRVRAPQAAMEPAGDAVIDQVVAASPGQAKYGTAVDAESAFELLQARAQEQAAGQAAAEGEAAAAGDQKELAKERARLEKEVAAREKAEAREKEKAARDRNRVVGSLARTAGTVIVRELTRSLFGTRRR
ncbi:helicase HerA-like domain-containing protein [Promicromonospora iranensis]|uniref:helicase HerA-like domain-containing protein n=1 Tax=Promicromonospora iranensis TaxID=1105144 RepID=UPI0023A9D976|nr:helicase HerA-like domain-containing protein [Promicromonospora iranensis]